MPDPATPEFPSFWRRSSVRRLVIGVTTVQAVVVLGVLGYMMLGWTPFDAPYMVVITISGVGFGEVRPMGSTAERVHTMLVISLGMIAVAIRSAGFVQFLTEGEILQLLGHQRMRRHIEESPGTRSSPASAGWAAWSATSLATAEVPFVVIERSPEKVADIESRGYLYVPATRPKRRCSARPASSAPRRWSRRCRPTPRPSSSP